MFRFRVWYYTVLADLAGLQNSLPAKYQNKSLSSNLLGTLVY